MEVNGSIEYSGLTSTGNNPHSAWYDSDKNLISVFKQQTGSQTLTVPTDAKYVRFTIVNADVNSFMLKTNISVTTLPISTYFPTGMKSAGDVYDELTPRKAIQRVKTVDLGSINWAGNASIGVFQTAVPLSDAHLGPQITFTKFTNYVDYFTYAEASSYPDGTIGVNPNNSTIYVKDTRYASFDAIKADLSGVYLYYELATPTETPIATEDANEALSLLMGKSVSSNNAKQMIDIITKGE